MTKILEELRKKHPRFFYRNFKISLKGDSLRFTFTFELEPGIFFNPEVSIQGVGPKKIEGLGKKTLDNFAFHLGLMEIPSYWKAACSPEIIVEAGYLDNYQKDWWRNLLIKGMGEFYFINQIDFTALDFVSIKSRAKKRGDFLVTESPKYSSNQEIQGLVPLGGGKDSIVTLEFLKETNIKPVCFTLNPIPSVLEIAKISQTSPLITATRQIDSRLLELNKNGYLNGHTPFSAYVAFLSVTCASLFGYRYSILSNERSSNEENVQYLGQKINHQYSKSFEFEKLFQEYSKKYLTSDIEYFSFLRPFFELQIARFFSSYPQYFSVFRSCNQGQKTNTWCQNCPKCLFIFTALYPFIEKKQLTEKIFSQDLFEKAELTELALALLGQKKSKPFECVGTYEETKVAFYLCVKKAKAENLNLPIVLKTVNEQVLARESNLSQRAISLLHSWNEKNSLPESLKAFSKQALLN